MHETRVEVSHVTEYRYSARVELAHHVAHLAPRPGPGQRVDDFELKIEPPVSDRQDSIDAFGNVRSTFALYLPHQSLRVAALSRLTLSGPDSSRMNGAAGIDPIDHPPSPAWEQVREALQYRRGAPFVPASEFAFASPFVPKAPELAEYARASFAQDRPLVPTAIELMQRVHADFRYCTESTEVSTPLLESFRARSGVCQDFSHVMLGCFRSLGLAARYVSGYLVGGSLGGQAAPVGAHASHAWVSVYCPQWGWIDLDATNDVVPDPTTHITVAIGRDYGDVTPLRGVIRGGGQHTLSVAVHVTRLDNDLASPLARA